jgi:hypothetical protein
VHNTGRSVKPISHHHHRSHHRSKIGRQRCQRQNGCDHRGVYTAIHVVIWCL